MRSLDFPRTITDDFISSESQKNNEAVKTGVGVF